MISIMGRTYTGWQESFVRACNAMTRAGLRTRELTPRGRISADNSARCPNCQADCYFTGQDLECGKFYETAVAHFCANCGRFELVTDERTYWNNREVLKVLKFKVSHAPQTCPPSQGPEEACPVCGAETYTLQRDLGGVDYYDNYWTACTNPFCDWPGAHREEFGFGPYTTSSGPSASWTSEILQYQTVFLSYNTGDQEFADLIFDRLVANGVRCWYAPHEMQGGSGIRDQIQSGIRSQQRLLLIVSTASAKSTWVKYEVSEARRLEKSLSRRILFPISLIPLEEINGWYLDEDDGSDFSEEIRAYHVPDFSDWRSPERFASEFAKLLKALACQ